jgi:hypothetical protein
MSKSFCLFSILISLNEIEGSICFRSQKSMMSETALKFPSYTAVFIEKIIKLQPFYPIFSLRFLMLRGISHFNSFIFNYATSLEASENNFPSSVIIAAVNFSFTREMSSNLYFFSKSFFLFLSASMV